MENLTRGLMALVPPPPACGGYRKHRALGDTSSMTYSAHCRVFAMERHSDSCGLPGYVFCRKKVQSS